MKVLDIGCGNSKAPGALGVDMHADTQADIVHDLNKYPWPFPDNEFDLVICNDILEHLEDVIKAIEEIHRVSRKGATVQIRVPHFSSPQAYADITHKHFFTSESFDCFCEENHLQKYYSKARFKKISMKFNFTRFYSFISVMANRFPHHYERYFSYIFPSGNIEFKFVVIK
jgi:ubiquinone/menaquinone biosynthesis C-methylase UbiE